VADGSSNNTNLNNQGGGTSVAGIAGAVVGGVVAAAVGATLLGVLIYKKVHAAQLDDYQKMEEINDIQ